MAVRCLIAGRRGGSGLESTGWSGEVWIQQSRTQKREENVQGRKIQVGQWVLDSKEQNKQDRLGGGVQRIVDGSV